MIIDAQRWGTSNSWELFQQSLRDGQWGEMIFEKYLKEKGFTINERGDTSALDIKATKSSTWTFEVKTDIYEMKNSLTNNCFIEFCDIDNIESKKQNKIVYKPTGISLSKADYYICFFPFQKEVYVIETELLKKKLDKNSISNNNGSSGHVRSFLVNKNNFKKIPLDWEKYDDGKTEEWFEWFDLKRKGLL